MTAQDVFPIVLLIGGLGIRNAMTIWQVTGIHLWTIIRRHLEALMNAGEASMEQALEPTRKPEAKE